MWQYINFYSAQKIAPNMRFPSTTFNNTDERKPGVISSISHT